VFEMSKKKDFELSPESLMDFLDALQDPRIDRTNLDHFFEKQKTWSRHKDSGFKGKFALFL
jgi:hypothetical protein